MKVSSIAVPWAAAGSACDVWGHRLGRLEALMKDQFWRDLLNGDDWERKMDEY